MQGRGGQSANPTIRPSRMNLHRSSIPACSLSGSVVPHPRPGKPGGGGTQGPGSGSEPSGDEAAEGLGLGRGCHRRDADVLLISPSALDTDPHQQPVGADHAGDPETDTGSGSVSGRQLGAHALCSQAEAHCRNEVGNAEISPDE